MRKLTRKLLLSMFTLAVCAVTLVSTTFAWYTTNTEVSANGVQGTSTGDTADSTLLISATGATGSYSSSCEPTEIGGSELLPLQFKENTLSFLSSGTVSTGNYLQFKIWVKTTKTETVVTDGEGNETVTTPDIPVYIENIILTNTSTQYKVDNLLSGQSVSGAPADGEYSVNIIRALNMYTTVDSSITSHLDLTGIGDLTGYAEVGHASGMDAVKYYNAVMKKTDTTNSTTTKDDDPISGSSNATAMSMTESGYDAIKICDLKWDSAANAYAAVCVTFTVYLDGWDQYCFDACRQQSFNISISFTTDSGKVDLGTAK